MRHYSIREITGKIIFSIIVIVTIVTIIAIAAIFFFTKNHHDVNSRTDDDRYHDRYQLKYLFFHQ